MATKSTINNPNPKFPSGGEEYPTLLHWAARFGLERLCWQLLECPGGGAACALRNVRHLTPAELAREQRHDKLADVLASHMVRRNLGTIEKIGNNFTILGYIYCLSLERWRKKKFCYEDISVLSSRCQCCFSK